ncbi:hypothetical protein ASF69_04600 [Rhizobium sp. Leaf311]|uniref:hypothetical protein n=1 Tax=Rhizobium sp. Leaf311 TaxID=1736332 RepID=UPI0007141ABB|nr:hypothetical protein [Rhizobium sp. Leaf311]KQQ46511.1 hypothetical protein ASF69_04600 [Rhizobium sp. Leaf311]
MDIAGSISAVTSALGLVKELREIDAQFDKAEMKLKVAELTVALSDAKLGLVDVAQTLKQKDQEIETLKSALVRKHDTVESDGYFYRKQDDGRPIGNAFCPVCLEDGKFVLTVQSLTSGMPYVCPKCKANFGYLASYLA